MWGCVADLRAYFWPHEFSTEGSSYTEASLPGLCSETQAKPVLFAVAALNCGRELVILVSFSGKGMPFSYHTYLLFLSLLLSL